MPRLDNKYYLKADTKQALEAYLKAVFPELAHDLYNDDGSILCTEFKSSPNISYVYIGQHYIVKPTYSVNGVQVDPG